MRRIAMPGRGLRLAIATDTWTPQLNGVTRTLARLVREARERGFEVRVYTPFDPAAHPESEVITFQSRSFWAYPQLRMSWPRAAELEHRWRDWRPDLVHAATPFGAGLAARSAALACRIPFVTSYHTSLSAYAAFYQLGWLTEPAWALFRWFHNSGLRTWCPTRAIAAELQARGFRGTAVWGRGVDMTVFNPAWRSGEFRRSHGVRDEEFLVTYVGRIAREKGIEGMLESMHEVQRRASRPIRLMMVGDGPFDGAARNAAPPGTVFTGTLSGIELSAAFASGDLFLFPSMTDTFGNVVLEAFASGVPVLAADCAVTRELLGEDGGFYFSQTRALADEVLRLMAAPRERHQAAEAGLRRASTRSWEAIFDNLFEQYRYLAEGTEGDATRSRPMTSLLPEAGIVAHS